MDSHHAIERLQDLYGVRSRRSYIDPYIESIRSPTDLQLLLMHIRGYLKDEVSLRDVPIEQPDYAHSGKGLTTKIWRDWMRPDPSFFFLRSEVTALPACRYNSSVYHRGETYSFETYFSIFLQNVMNLLENLIYRKDIDSIVTSDTILLIFTPEALFQMYPTSVLGGRHVYPGFVNVWWHFLETIIGEDYSQFYHPVLFSTFVQDTFAQITQSSSLDNPEAALIVQNCIRILSEEESSSFIYRSNVGAYVKNMRAYRQLFRLPNIGKVQGVKLVIATTSEIIVCTSYDKEYISPDDEPLLIPQDFEYRLRDQSEEILRTLMLNV